MKIISLVLPLLLTVFFFSCGNNKSGSSAKELAGYQTYLSSLDKGSINSISEGLNYYRKNSASLNEEEKDSAFVLFRGFYYLMINEINNNYWNNDTLAKKLGSPDAKLKEELDKNGIRISMTEGEYYLDEKPDYLLNSFGSSASPAVKEYLQLRKKELEEGFSEDAGLLIPFEKLGERIIAWEKYLKRYPSSPLKADALFSYKLYLGTFLTGMDNSRVFDENNKILPENLNILNTFAEKYSGTDAGKTVSEYLRVLKNNNYTFSTAAVSFLESKELEAMIDVQPPTR